MHWGSELGCPDNPWPPCSLSDMGVDTGQAQGPPMAMGYSPLQPVPKARGKMKVLLINTDYIQRGDISTQPSTPWVSWPGGSQSPVGHSLSLPAQPGRGAQDPETFGLKPPAANTAPARVPSQEEPPWWHSPMQTFLGDHPCGGQHQGGAGAAPNGCSTGNETPRGATVPQPPALSPQPVGGDSVPGWKGLVDNHLHNKILLDLGLLQSCAVSEQLA